MSNLPTSRTTPATAFERVRVNFAVPFNVKSKLRCRAFTKFYLALYICLTTKAVQLEKVDGLSTEDFIVTFRRFIARREHPSIISSNNGTNFTGTNNKLCELYKFVSNLISRTLLHYSVSQRKFNGNSLLLLRLIM